MINQKMQIQDFNQQLINENQNLLIVDYIKLINDKFYKIDISFIDDFIDLVNKDEYCIHHEMLEKYEVLTIKNNSYKVKRLLEQNEFEESKDYVTRSYDGVPLLGQCDESDLFSNKKEYFLKPDTFKTILARSTKTKKYMNYYLLLEKCVFFYNQYEK